MADNESLSEKNNNNNNDKKPKPKKKTKTSHTVARSTTVLQVLQTFLQNPFDFVGKAGKKDAWD